MATGGETPGIYFLKGTRYNISDAIQTFSHMASAINEVSLEVGNKSTKIQRVVERVQTLMATHYGQIKRESKLREKAKNLRTQIRKQMTEIQSKVWETIEMDPRDVEAVSKARILNDLTVELQRLSLDETAITLIIRKDMSYEELKKDQELRAEMHVGFLYLPFVLLV